MTSISPRGMSVIELVVLMGLAATLTLAAVASLAPKVEAAIRVAVECIINDGCG